MTRRCLAASLGIVSACGTGPSPSVGPGDAGAASVESGAHGGTVGDDAIEAEATTYRGFAKIDRSAFHASLHLGHPLVDVYANALAAPTYRSLDFGVPPDAPVAFRPGSMLVKAMQDADGGVDVLTVMYKMSPGYDPEHGDWWYGRLDARGAPTNPSYVGVVGFCVQCHIGTAQSDYAWGVAATNKQ